MNNYIDAAAFRDMILCADAALHANMQTINELNVFPVPDGDTGTNMGLTMGNAAVELRKKSFSTVEEVSGCVASALLRGARGNSGVILSLLFRGISRRLKGLETAGPEEFTAAMNEGVDAAYKAVMKPAEGTILTVSRLASAAAAQAAGAGSDLETCLVCAIRVGDQALEDTTNQNPVLKKAGVVDAGGMGYLVILRAILGSLRGELHPDDAIAGSGGQKEGTGVFTADKVEIPTENIFDTVYIVKKKSFDIDLRPLRLYLDSIGDSLVISEDDEIFKVHVHTDIPASALTESLNYGELVVADIENMRMQAEAQQRGEEPMTAQGAEDYEVGKKSSGGDKPEEAVPSDKLEFAEAKQDYGVVSVCAGAGMESLFLEDLGCDAVVTGGQTMNPSTDDILHAIARTPASTVFVLPNNKNIIMAAQQAVPLAAEHDRKVIVVPTTTVPQGVSAMLAFNVDAEAGQLAVDMTDAARNVHTAMVTYAAFDREFDGHSIHAGEYLALLDGALLGSYSSIPTLFKELNWAINEFSPEFITVYYGADVTADDAAEAAGTITGCFPDAEVNVVNGGQPVYYYMISVE
ncbi:MAG: DAK2 domain-containing protein [Oscillospiraceae bacterium]|nr:DAK2 domain-containing protein [Oscillospiraceae bacterium]